MNVLVVSFDALRADVLGLYGHPGGTSPNLDLFAEKALVFDRAFTVAPVTPTSFAGAWSGRYPSTVFRGWRFTEPEPLALQFHRAGYQTAAFLNNVQLTPERGFQQGFDVYEIFTEETGGDVAIIRQGLQWLAHHRASEQPFFEWLHLINPHAPYDRRDMAIEFYDQHYEGPFAESSGNDFSAETPADLRRLRSLYEGEVFYIDRLFGVVVDTLEELDLLHNTLVVVTADHGEEFMERGSLQHKHLNDETIRIPLMIRHPDLPAGDRTEVLVSNMDLYPTLLSLVGVEVPGSRDGQDMRLLSPHRARSIVSIAMTGKYYRAAALRTPAEKLILECAPELHYQYYDLRADPSEEENLIDSSRRRARELTIQLASSLNGDPCAVIARAVAGKNPEDDLSDDSIKALKALGYL